MKNSIALIIALVLAGFIASTAFAQTFPGLDDSPADIAYLRKSRAGEAVAKVVYSRPQMKGRKVFGDLVPFDEVWRTGANESTEITFYNDVQFNGQFVPAGTYALFSIPGENSWTMILNKVLHQWGAFSYQENQDFLRTDVPVNEDSESVEAFTIVFAPGADGVDLVLAWENTRIIVPIDYE